MYTIVLTVTSGVILALTALGLAEPQKNNVDMEKKQNILQTVMKVESREEAVKIYGERVKAYVINFKGEIVKNEIAEKIDVSTEYKKKPEERLLPVFEILTADKSKSEFYVLPLYGFGLWNNIWGYVSIKGDLNTINGIKLAHAGETPGLGARITEDEIQKRFANKQIFDAKGALMSVVMQKGEGNNYDIDKHKVDGMSGATITGKGVNNMLKDYFGCYEKFLQSKKGNSPQVSMN
jgi:Na+-transporting NADH:ubiquinone oxidoreductase subunit C